tara:strand:- start:675 stop:872 length:198 start_codon:yes stop_codon:yes gene_type:complete
MKLLIGQLIKITLDEREQPLLATVIRKLHDDYELAWTLDNKVIKHVMTREELIKAFTSGHCKLVI